MMTCAISSIFPRSNENKSCQHEIIVDFFEFLQNNNYAATREREKRKQMRL